MGHTIDQWRDKVARLLRDQAGVDVKAADLDVVGIEPAFAEHSRAHPREAVVELTGADSAYFDLPDGWESGSELLSVEWPARQNPPVFLDSCHWRVGRSEADVDLEQIVLRYMPSVSQYVRFTFTARWPIPTDTADEDLLDDSEFEAVAALAAACCCDALATGAARNIAASLPTNFVGGQDRQRMLSAVAGQFREQYSRFVDSFWGVV